MHAAMDHARYGRSVGVIAAAERRADIAAAFDDRDVDFVDAATGHLGGSINLVSPVDAKGLEFDAVVLVEPEAIVAEHNGGERLLYVALTRTTKYLTVVHAGAPLPLEDTAAPATDERADGDTGESPVPRKGGGRRRAPDSTRRVRPKRIALAVAQDLADQVADSVATDHWDVIVEALIDELDRRRS